MTETIIEIKNISKQYTIAHEQGRYLALRDVLMNIFKNPMSFVMAKAKSAIGASDQVEVWALKDINFSVKKGEIVGIIGKNGAGKSTLLKILSQITPPSTGEIRLHGRVGSLLEVGTGFHPELTGRENIFLNGAILGMSRKEIAQKFDRIVEFAGVSKFLDTPVKYYSSGMYVRLAFSVAAHMEPDILIIDEVLAVGDAEFQKKCIGKMNEITQKEHRTILFVSHNMAAVEQLCSRVVLLKGGKIEKIGDTKEMVAHYIADIHSNENAEKIQKVDDSKEISFTKIWISDRDGHVRNAIDVDQDFTVHAEFSVTQPQANAEISFNIRNSAGINIVLSSLSDSFDRKFVHFTKGIHRVHATFRKNFLIPDTYSVTALAHVRGVKTLDILKDAIGFTIIETGKSVMAPYGEEGSKYWSCVFSNAEWGIDES